MTTLTPERLRELRALGKAYLTADEYLALFDHIDALQSERDALATVAAHDVVAFERAMILTGSDPEYAAIRVQPMKDALLAAGRLP